jgi:hypothetical protein
MHACCCSQFELFCSSHLHFTLVFVFFIPSKTFLLFCLLQRPRRTRRSFLPWFITLVLVGAAWFKLFTLSSVLNKMAYQGTW